MKQSTKIAIAGLLSAAGSLLNAFAAEFGEGVSETSSPETPAPKRGKKAAAPAATTEPPADPVVEPPAVPEEPATTGEGKTYEELRALIEPLVKGGQGEEVKKVIAKYSQSGLKGMEAKHHASFEKDIQALSY